jgi:hypothetical protein
MITTSRLTAVKTTTDLPEGTNLYYTDERAQDAVGTILTDTASVDFTYNDAGNTISAAVLPAGVDHNSLSNYVADQHVAHSGVSIATAAGTSGLSGGGTIAATRNLVVDIIGLTEDTDPAVDDSLMYWDTSASERNRIQLKDLMWNDPNRIYKMHWEFLESSPANAGWTVTSSGAGAASATSTTGVDATEKCMGVVQSSSGTTATGRSSVMLDPASTLFGSAELRLIHRFQVDTLSTVTEAFTAYHGFTDVAAAGDQVDGAYFRYTDVGASPNWKCVTRSNSTETVTDSGVAAVTTFEKFEIVVNAAGTSVAFKINGTTVATHTTNIPTAANRFTGVGWKIEKSVGLTSRMVRADYVALMAIYSGGR